MLRQRFRAHRPNPRTTGARTSRALATAAVALAAALGVAACSAPDETADTSGAASAPPPEPGAIPVTIDHQYGSTTIDRAPTRVAAMGVGDADNLLALGVTPTTIAPFAAPDQQKAPWNERLIGDSDPVVLNNVSAQFGDEIARALATNPDLITAVGAAPTREQYDKVAAAAPTIVRPGNFPDWQVPWDVQATEIGRAIGQPQAAERKIADVKAQLAEIRDQRPQFAGKTGVVVTSAPNGGVTVYGGGDGRAQTLSDYGLTFPEQLRPVLTGGFYGELPAENMDLLNSADVVVVVDWDGGNSRLQSDARWSQLPVVTQGRVVYLDQQVGSAMSVPSLLSIPWVAEQAIGPITDAVAKSPA